MKNGIVRLFSLLSFCMLCTPVYSFAKDSEAVFLGVENYGAEETNAENRDHFRYRFSMNGKEISCTMDNGTQDANGTWDYPLQNLLKVGSRYRLTLEAKKVTAAEEIPQEVPPFTPAVSGTPGLRTLSNFLRTALMPVGTALYIYGGGWDWQDTGSAVQARTLGVSPDWVRFFREQDESFTYKSKDGDEANRDPASSYYPYGGFNQYYYAGLDCSGYLGWAVYNTLETESGKAGYVGGAGRFARRLADAGWGTWNHEASFPSETESGDLKPGDIVSIDGHVWISLGTCADGSAVIIHSTPSLSRTGQPGGGVQISAVWKDENCEAYALADRYMKRFCPEWYARYPAVVRSPEVYYDMEAENAGLFRWHLSESGFADPEGLRDMRPADVLELLLGQAL